MISKIDGVYGRSFSEADGKFQFSANRKFTVGAGTRYEWVNYKPGIRSAFEISGKNEYVTTYGISSQLIHLNKGSLSRQRR